MSDQGSPQVTDRHLLQFGRIVQAFARHEVLMQAMMAAVSGADVESIRVLTASLRFPERRDALLALLRQHAVPVDRIEQVRAYLQVPSSFMALRNDIVHAAWTEAIAPGSIWPVWLSHGPRAAIKPVRDPAARAKELGGRNEDRLSYTLDDLTEIGQNLTSNYSGMAAYVLGAGLARSTDG